MGLDFFSKRKLRKEVKHIKAKLEDNGNRFDLRLKLAGLYRKLNKDKEAKKQYLTVTQGYLDENKRGQAEAVCKNVLEYYPDNEQFNELLQTILGEKLNEDSQDEPHSEEEKNIDDETDFEQSKAVESDSQSDDVKEINEAMDDFAMSDEPTPIAEYNNMKEFLLDHEDTKEQEEWSDDLSDPDKNRIPSPPRGIPRQKSSLRQSISSRFTNPNQESFFKKKESNPDNEEVIDVFDEKDLGFFEEEQTEDTLANSQASPPVQEKPVVDIWEESPLLKELEPHVLEVLKKQINVQKYEAEEVVFYEGDKGKSLYLIKSGQVNVTKIKPGGEEVLINTLGALDFFGEFALLVDHKRHASIKTITEVELVKIPKKVIVNLGKKYPSVIKILKSFYKKRLQELMLKNIPFFDLISTEKRSKYLGNIRFRRFSAGANIIKQGQKSGGFFLVLFGEVKIIHRQDQNETLLGVLSEGEYFGEMALMKRKPAMATVKASKVVELVQIPAKTFFQILADHPQIWRHLKDEIEKRTLFDHYFITGKGSGSLSF
ncbi:MAG: cyclic nucleotide-binding domain-containing protein [Deltaproteobacteria bacterium]|jgi:CRP-like cAMP-binding protein|nr:cyclic nucleotide-binding domain-containing protein [Deltaproteobacteria bacterium]